MAATLVAPLLTTPALGSEGAGFAADSADSPASLPRDAVEAAFKSALEAASPTRVDAVVASDLAARLQRLAAEAATNLAEQGFSRDRIVLELFVNLRYQGTDTALMTPCLLDASAASALAAGGSTDSQSTDAKLSSVVGAAVSFAPSRFVEAYRREFGFVLLGRAVLVDDVRVRGTALGGPVAAPSAASVSAAAAVPAAPVPSSHASVYFEGGRVSTPVFQLADLRYGHEVRGPALLVDPNTTIVVEPGFTAALTPGGDVDISFEDPPLVEKLSSSSESGSAETLVSCGDDAYTFADIPAVPVQLSIFGHRFMGIAEQMGRVLQRTSISVNIRERLDFSCALFGPTGGLVAVSRVAVQRRLSSSSSLRLRLLQNAPHIPVHLGAMQEAVRYQVTIAPFLAHF